MAHGKMKSLYGIYKKHGRDQFLEAAAYYTCHAHPDSISKTIDEMESRWYDRTRTQTEAEKMVEDYNNGITILNEACLAYVDTGSEFRPHPVQKPEADRSFAVVHFHKGDEDCFFTSEVRDSFFSIANLYHAALYREVGQHELDSIVQTHILGSRQINDDMFSSLCDAMPNDPRITALVEFDFDNNTVSVCESSDNAWLVYDLKDVSEAMRKAVSKDGLSLETRREIFATALEGKEIAFDTDEDEGPVPEMQPT